MLRYKKSHGALAIAKTKSTKLNNPHPRHPLLGNSQAPQNQRTPPPPIQHPRRKQDKAIPPSRQVRKDIIEMKPKQDKTLPRAPRTNQKNLTAPSADREERIKLLLLNLKRKVHRIPNRTATGAGNIPTRQKPRGGGPSDFSMGQGGRGIA